MEAKVEQTSDIAKEPKPVLTRELSPQIKVSVNQVPH